MENSTRTNCLTFLVIIYSPCDVIQKHVLHILSCYESPSCKYFKSTNWQLLYLNQWKGEISYRNDVLTNLYKRCGLVGAQTCDQCVRLAWFLTTILVFSPPCHYQRQFSEGRRTWYHRAHQDLTSRLWSPVVGLECRLPQSMWILSNCQISEAGACSQTKQVSTLKNTVSSDLKISVTFGWKQTN